MVYVRKYQSKKVKTALNPKKDSITLEEAKERFNQYYNTRSSTKEGRIRSKIGDIRYNKTDPKRVLTPNTPGSAKYMLPEGPRTFDMVGVDYFPEGTEYAMIEDPEYGELKINLKGTPKLKTGESYKSHFKNTYLNRKLNKDVSGSFEEGQSLVNHYWDTKYKVADDEGKPLKRPRKALKDWDYKRKGEHITESYFLLGKNEIFFEYGGNIYYLDSNMKVYDFNHKFLSKLRDMDKNIIDELNTQGYIELTKSGYPKWTDNIYNWTIYYKYYTPENKEIKIKLNMNDMIVRNVNTDEALGDWNAYLIKNNLDYTKVTPYDMRRDGIIKAPSIHKPEPIIIDDIERVITKTPESTPKIIEEKTQLTPQITTEETQLIPEIIEEKTQLIPEITTEETKLTPEITTEETQLIPEIIEEKTQLAPQITTEETQLTPQITTEETQLTPEMKEEEPEEEVDFIEDLEELQEPEKEDSKLNELGFKLIEHNGKKYYLQTDTNRYISSDTITDQMELFELPTVYDVLNAVKNNLWEIPYITDLAKSEQHDKVVSFVDKLEQDKVEENKVTVTKEVLTNIIDDVVKNSEITNSIVNDIENEQKDTNTLNITPEILTNIIEDNKIEHTHNQMINEINKNSSPVISVDKDNIEEKLNNYDIEYNQDDLKQSFQKLDENNTSDIPVNEEDINGIDDLLAQLDEDEAGTEDYEEGAEDYEEGEEDYEEGEEDYEEGEDEYENEYEAENKQKWQIKKPLMKINIIPSVENYRSREFDNLIKNVKPANIITTDNERRNEITKYIYDSFHNNPNQEDAVFPNVVDTPKMKKVNNESFKKEMNSLIKKVNTYIKDYKPDTQEIINKQKNKNDYELTLLKNNQTVGDKIVISVPKYNLLISRMNKDIDEQTKDKIIWSLYYRYKYILGVTPTDYKDKCYRISGDNVPSKYQSMFYDLEQYFGSTGMC